VRSTAHLAGTTCILVFKCCYQPKQFSRPDKPPSCQQQSPSVTACRCRTATHPIKTAEELDSLRFTRASDSTFCPVGVWRHLWEAQRLQPVFVWIPWWRWGVWEPFWKEFNLFGDLQFHCGPFLCSCPTPVKITILSKCRYRIGSDTFSVLVQLRCI